MPATLPRSAWYLSFAIVAALVFFAASGCDGSNNGGSSNGGANNGSTARQFLYVTDGGNNDLLHLGLGRIGMVRAGPAYGGGINQNDLMNRSSEQAYNFLLAVFPLLLFFIAMLGPFASEGSSLSGGSPFRF